MARVMWIVINLAFGMSTAAAQQGGVSQEEFEKLKREMEELKKKVAEKETAVPSSSDPGLQTKEGQKRSGLYDRVSSFSRNVHLGGYLDLEYTNREETNDDTFDAHRFVPFLYADVTDHIKIAAELEIEHGEELGIEFSTIDYWIADAFNLRAGILLLPLGKFNLVHDAPYQDLTARPLVDTWVIPAVLRDPGLSVFGRFDADPWVFTYEVTVSNGFKGLNKTGSTLLINESTGLRDARPHEDRLGKGYRDFNDNKAVTGRVSASPFLGLEAGVSYHNGKYDERGDGTLEILALDATLRCGGIYSKFIGSGAELLRDVLFASEFAFEWAKADVEQTDVGPAVPEDLGGWFLEYRYHFMPAFLKGLPGTTDESTFTAVLRVEAADLDDSRTRRTTIGLNFRPVEETVFKFEYQWTDESGDKAEVDDDAFLFSIATYF